MKKVQHWLYQLGKSAVQGGMTGGSAWLALAGGNAIDASIPTLNLKGLGIVIGISALKNLIFYLKDNPLPPEKTGDTEITAKP